MVSVFAGWEDRLHKPGTICAMVSVERCNLVRSNVFQRQPVLILRRGVHRQGAEDDDSDSNQHCRNETYGEEAVDVFHKRSFQALWKTVNDEDKKPLPSHVGSVAVKLMQLDRTQRQRVTHVNACCVENYFGAKEAAIASNRGSPRSGSQSGCRRK